MTDNMKEQLLKKTKQGKLLTLILLLYGLVVTLIIFLSISGERVEWLHWLAPFTIASMPIRYYMHPAVVFIPLAVLALVGWLLLHKGQLFGREIIIGCMIVYLALNLFFTPFYMLLVSTSQKIDYVGQILGLSLCGTIYPVLVLIALHRWNPRRK